MRTTNYSDVITATPPLATQIAHSTIHAIRLKTQTCHLAIMSDDKQDTLPPGTPDVNSTESEGRQQVERVEGTNLAPWHTQPAAEPSIEHPTREFLDKNCLKPDLQKRCRELGIRNIWANKSQLIEMILEKVQLEPGNMQPNPTEIGATLTPSTQHQQNTATSHEDNDESEELSFMHVAREIKMIKTKLATKDMEIDLLNTEVRAAYHTIEQLQQRVTELEQGKKGCDTGDKHSNTCLLLGDTNLHPISSSDLHHSCWLRTIPGANMDLLKCWVNDKLRKSPSECIIYCGSEDVIEEHSPATVLDNLSSLICNLKEKNNTMNVYVCKVVPYSLQREVREKIEAYNDQLAKWGETNGIPVIDTVPVFTLGTGELDDLCFNEGTDSKCPTLNRLGTIKLLTTINKQCPQLKLCPDWQVKRKTYTFAAQSNERRSTGQGNTKQASSPPALIAATHARTTPTHLPASGAPHSYARSSSPRHASSTSYKPPSRRPFTAPDVSNYTNERRRMREQWADENAVGSARDFHTYAAALSGTAETRRHTPNDHSIVHTPGEGMGRHGRDSPRSFIHTSDLREHNHYSSRDGSQRDQNYTGGDSERLWKSDFRKRKIGCFNCGEFNHVQAKCRFDHKLLCGFCRRLGHKSRLCQHYTT